MSNPWIFRRWDCEPQDAGLDDLSAWTYYMRDESGGQHDMKYVEVLTLLASMMMELGALNMTDDGIRMRDRIWKDMEEIPEAWL